MDLWCLRRPLYQLSRNHSPKIIGLIKRLKRDLSSKSKFTIKTLFTLPVASVHLGLCSCRKKACKGQQGKFVKIAQNISAFPVPFFLYFDQVHCNIISIKCFPVKGSLGTKDVSLLNKHKKWSMNDFFYFDSLRCNWESELGIKCHISPLKNSKKIFISRKQTN